MPRDTNLHKACTKGDLETVEELLDEGKLDVNCLGASNRTPLHRAVSCGSYDIVQLLLSRGADVQARDNGKMTPFHWAAMFGEVEVGELLVANGADINAQTRHGETALHLAAEAGKKPFVAWLIEIGEEHDVKFDVLNKEDKTAYLLAKDKQQTEIAKMLKFSAPAGCC